MKDFEGLLADPCNASASAIAARPGTLERRQNEAAEGSMFRERKHMYVCIYAAMSDTAC